MTRISRGLPIPRKINKAELSDFVIGVGYCKGELFPPYKDSEHERIGKHILSYLQERPHQGIAGLFFYSALERDPPPRLEVVGGYTDLSVTTAVEELLKRGSIVHVNPTRIFTNVPLPAYWNGRILIREVLRDMPDVKCHIYKGDLIFYKR